MAEATYNWPSKADSRVLGTEVDRVDGLVKATGAAKYAYDINAPKMLFAVGLSCPHAHARVVSVETAAAEKTPGVVKVLVQNGTGKEIQWQGDIIAFVAAESEGAAREGAKKIEVKYEMLDVFVDDSDLAGAEKAGRTHKAGGKVQLENEPGDDEDEEEFENKEIARLLQEAKHVVEGYYGIDAITHCCLEPHGSTASWDGKQLTAWLSTQNVSGTDEQYAASLELTADDVEVQCQYIGGGFGSKFQVDYWGVAAAKISKETGRPVKLMLDRDQELKIAGNRPSGFIKVKLGADADGVVQVWDSEHWGTAGFTGSGVSHNVIPYVYMPPNYRRNSIGIKTNTDQSRAWRAPNHPQACAMSQTAYDDLARVMKADSLEIFKKNLKHIESRQKAEVYAAEMDIAAKLMDWKAKWHLHGQGPKKGSIVEGLGLGIHTWGGGANSSNCTLKLYPDGSVETFCGTQDLGTGTRTVCQMVVAETFGLKPEQVKVNIGSSKMPVSGASGGSTTVGAVSESHRRAAQDAAAALFDLVAKKLSVAAEDLVADNGRIHAKGNADKGLAWKEATALVGLKPVEFTSSFKSGQPTPLSSAGVGGVQMAHVAVDLDTGIVKMVKHVAVQDMGLIVNPRLAKSQIYGAVIQGISAALFEQRIMDPKSGAFVNAELSDYKLPRLGDIGEIVIELYEPESERARGVIGLGEPPVISPSAAISNAVCNAIGVRVPVLPLTPKRVLDAIKAAHA
jgi:xanthine dehydrogenase YagR molybdenum-binding subunit